MTDFRIRTEDLTSAEVQSFYVETRRDKLIVADLCAANPIIIEGSRGTGKSFLMRVAEGELLGRLQKDRILPVYVSFVKSSLVHTSDPQQFQHWMLARVCARILRVLYRNGLMIQGGNSLNILAGGPIAPLTAQTTIETVANQYEESYRNPGVEIDSTSVPSVESFRDAIEDLCEAVNIRRLALFFDEAAHIFLPEQQRQFFTLFRDLRSPYISCNAAVYPGVTVYGTAFQTYHDATILELNRDVLEDGYRKNMREIVAKQASADLMANIDRNGENFDSLAYAVAGNPRLLLKTVAAAPRLNSTQVTEVLKGFYRNDIWTEHSELAERYAGHRALVDWGRTFIENHAIPDTMAKNRQRAQANREESTCFIWIHRDAPEAVREAMRLLAYTGVVVKGDSGVVATRREIGTRYSINLGCLVAPDANPISTMSYLSRHLTVRRFTEYGANYQGFRELADSVGSFEEPDMSTILEAQLQKPVSVLDITEFQNGALRQCGITTVGHALRSKEEQFQSVHYIGPKRSRQMMNAAVASVLEYLSG